MPNIWAIHEKAVALSTTPQRTVQLLVVLLRKYNVQYAADNDECIWVYYAAGRLLATVYLFARFEWNRRPFDTTG